MKGSIRTIQSRSQEDDDAHEQAKILKSQLANQFTIENYYTCDFWGSSEVLKSMMTRSKHMSTYETHV